MSETSHNDSADRPDGVTDPLLWRLALGVADAHEPDGEGGCRNLLCDGEAWPCTPWNNAQRALQIAQAEESAEATGETVAYPGWSGVPVRPAARRAGAAARASEATASAA
ncbi:hypothetical protein [Micromonospora sp. WMMD812]|uniref:hypothetical protein n=1 Tax=Micromonospora sp. WMMD812 TaxID=3015152 RepID=UPI00248D06F4|nr:hypothetical protein [Micromonospora sp. WMMD812]WBB69366.1 hypothetical protein O7603_08455 [Micromonospora sp. WMMD812]